MASGRPAVGAGSAVTAVGRGAAVAATGAAATGALAAARPRARLPTITAATTARTARTAASARTTWGRPERPPGRAEYGPESVWALEPVGVIVSTKRSRSRS